MDSKNVGGRIRRERDDKLCQNDKIRNYTKLRLPKITNDDLLIHSFKCQHFT